MLTKVRKRYETLKSGVNIVIIKRTYISNILKEVINTLVLTFSFPLYSFPDSILFDFCLEPNVTDLPRMSLEMFLGVY